MKFPWGWQSSPSSSEKPPLVHKRIGNVPEGCSHDCRRSAWVDSRQSKIRLFHPCSSTSWMTCVYLQPLTGLQAMCPGKPRDPGWQCAGTPSGPCTTSQPCQDTRYVSVILCSLVCVFMCICVVMYSQVHKYLDIYTIFIILAQYTTMDSKWNNQDVL